MPRRCRRFSAWPVNAEPSACASVTLHLWPRAASRTRPNSAIRWASGFMPCTRDPCKTAAGPCCRLHDCRHTHLSILLQGWKRNVGHRWRNSRLLPIKRMRVIEHWCKASVGYRASLTIVKQQPEECGTHDLHAPRLAAALRNNASSESVDME